MYDFARHNSPLQEITRTVENPGSVLWIDNVWPGFDEKARAWMVENYLDGVHLHTLGLNDGKGHLYVYRAAQEDYAESAKMLPDVEAARIKYDKALELSGGRTNKEVVSFQTKYFDLDGPYRAKRRKESLSIVKNPDIYSYTKQDTPEGLSAFAYKVEWNSIPISNLQQKYIWCDEVSIKESDRNSEIAINKRCLQYTPTLTVVYQGGFLFENGETVGNLHAFEFDDKVLFEYAKVKSSFESDRSRLEK